eukprot:5212759-Amphidinium_carterae.2
MKSDKLQANQASCAPFESFHPTHPKIARPLSCRDGNFPRAFNSQLCGVLDLDPYLTSPRGLSIPIHLSKLSRVSKNEGQSNTIKTSDNRFH